MLPVKVNLEECQDIVRDDGLINIYASPKTVNSNNLILGRSKLKPGGVLKNHIHDYSDECFYVLNGQGEIQTNTDATIEFKTGDVVFIPKGSPHRTVNTGDVELEVIFCISPLAPNPESGHRIIE